MPDPGFGRYELSVRTTQIYNLLDPDEYDEKLSSRFKEIESESHKEWKEWQVKLNFRIKPGSTGESSPKKIVSWAVFNLLPDFDKQSQPLNKPPYQIKEIGYGNFAIYIDIHFRSKLFSTNNRSKEEIDKIRRKTITHNLNLVSGERIKTTEWHKVHLDDPGIDFHEALKKNGIDFSVGEIETTPKSDNLVLESENSKPKKEKKKKRKTIADASEITGFGSWVNTKKILGSSFFCFTVLLFLTFCLRKKKL